MSTGRSGTGYGTAGFSRLFEGDDTKTATVELAAVGDRKEDASMAAVGFVIASATGVGFTSA